MYFQFFQAVQNVSIKDMPPIVPVLVTGSGKPTETSPSKPKAPAPQVPVQKKAEAVRIFWTCLPHRPSFCTTVGKTTSASQHFNK